LKTAGEEERGPAIGPAARTLLAVALLPSLAVVAVLALAAGLGRGPFAPVAAVGATATVTTTPPAATPAAPTATIPPPVVAVDDGAAGDEASNTTVAAPSFAPVIANGYAGLACDDDAAGDEGAAIQWQPLTLDFAGPPSDALGRPNPFLDYRLQVTFLGPSGQITVAPGYFAGDGRGGGRGNVWRVHFAADEPGRWRYCASFRAGPGVAVELDSDVGQPLAFDGAGGAFLASPPGPDAPDFFRWGRLEYAGGHYLKFRDGPYWLKGGANSPENFLGYAGFANTADQGGAYDGFLHAYAPHVADARPDDPTFGDEDAAAGILGALNYLSEHHVNSIYFLPMNLGGDGQDTYPYLSPDDATRFDVGKLDQWGVVLEHAQRRGIALHVVLNEVEEDNRRWLDGGALGVERRLFYREMVARFAHLPAIKWNLSEEVAFTPDELRAFAGYLAALDWADHPIAVHNAAGMADLAFGGLLGDALFSATSLQFAAEEAGALAEAWRAHSAAAGRPWIVDLDENNPAGVGLTPDNAGQLRKAILYDAYFSGAAGVEWYMGAHDLPLGGDLNLEDFRTRERMWDFTWYARRFMQENLPFPLMSPADELLAGEAEAFGGGEVLALAGEVYAIYLPAADPSGALAAPAGTYTLRWYDPRTGEFAGAPAAAATTDELPLGAPPHSPDGDWVVLVRRDGAATATPAPYPD
jgi:hypothetical protein